MYEIAKTRYLSPGGMARSENIVGTVGGRVKDRIGISLTKDPA